jgi:hypothetical protein
MLKNKKRLSKRNININIKHKNKHRYKKTKRIKNKNNKKLLKMIGGGEFDNLLCIVSNDDANVFNSREIRNDIDDYIIGNRYLIKLINTNYYYLIQITNVDIDNEHIFYNYVSNNELIKGSRELNMLIRSSQYVNYFMANNITLTDPKISYFGTSINNIQNVISEEVFGVLK